MKKNIIFYLLSLLSVSFVGDVFAKKDARMHKKASASVPNITIDVVDAPQEVEQQEVVVQQMSQIPEDAFLLDKIETVVYAQEGTQVITNAEVKRPNLDGRARNLDDIILERLMYLDAQRYKMASDEDTINKHLEAIRRDNNNMTEDDLKKIFADAGYTYEEGRAQFGIISIINQVMDFKIRSRLIVPEKEIRAYYKEHPEKESRAYLVCRAIVPYSDAKYKDEQENELREFIDHNKGFVSIEWGQPFWRNEEDLPADKKFITSLQLDQISDPVQTAEGFELFKLISVREERDKSLEDRYREISDVLRRPRYEQLFNAYKKELFDNASVVIYE